MINRHFSFNEVKNEYIEYLCIIVQATNIYACINCINMNIGRNILYKNRI